MVHSSFDLASDSLPLWFTVASISHQTHFRLTSILGSVARTGCQIDASRRYPDFRPLGRFAPVAVNTGLRPVTRKNKIMHVKIMCCLVKQSGMTKLFKKKEASELKSVRYPVRFTEAEAEAVRHSASIRNMSVAEFIRRAALGRRADVNYETKIVVQLSDVCRAIRDIHKGMLELGIAPPEEVWSPVMDEAMAAMLRIGN